MEKNINILILEHDNNDVELLQYQLKKSIFHFTSEVVQTKEEYENALSGFSPDIILSDYSLPAFDGLSAFVIRQNLAPETPFLIVSGTIGEEKAVELIKMGVTDYVLKEKMYQVGPKIERALKESKDRQQKDAAEQQLRKKEEHHQKILDLSLDLICTLDPEGKFKTVSAASKLLLDYLPEELIGRQVLDLVHDEDKNKVHKAITNLKFGIDIINLEYRFLRKSSVPVTLLWSVRWDEKDKLGYGIAKDVTDIKKAEEKIKHNERRFRTLLQNSTDGLTLLSSDGNIIERSSTALSILGLPACEASGKLRLDLVHPDDVPVVNDACAFVQQNPGDTITIEYRFLRPEGNYRWLEATLHNQLQEPAVGAIVINFRDITERKLAEITLEKSEEKYRNLFNLSPIPMWVFDVKSLGFLDVNESAIRHYGYSKSEFLVMTLNDIRPEEDSEKYKHIADPFAGAVNPSQETTRFQKKGGEVIDVEIRSILVELGGMEVRLVLAIDISERMKYIQAIEEQNKKLREITWIQSHVVRAPLARIMGLVSIMDNNPPDKVNTTDLLGFISSSAYELDNIIRGIVKKAELVKDKPVFEKQTARKK